MDRRTGRLRVWKWERAYGYYPFRERRRRIEDCLGRLSWSQLTLTREIVATDEADQEPDPWKLSSREPGLLASPPSIRPTAAVQPIIEIGSRRWLAHPAPDGQVIFLSVEDDADRMLARRRPSRRDQRFAQEAVVPGAFERA